MFHLSGHQTVVFLEKSFLKFILLALVLLTIVFVEQLRFGGLSCVFFFYIYNCEVIETEITLVVRVLLVMIS